MKTIRIVAVDDHPLMRRAIRHLLADCADMDLVAQGYNGSQVATLVETHRPDVLILDREMPLDNGDARFNILVAVRTLKRQYPALKIIILTGFADTPGARALIHQANVEGYVLKSDDPNTLLKAVRAVAAGRVYYDTYISNQLLIHQLIQLTETEKTILRLAADGISNHGIGKHIGRTENRVRKMFTDLYKKLGVTLKGDAQGRMINRRMLAVKIAREKGLL